MIRTAHPRLWFAVLAGLLLAPAGRAQDRPELVLQTGHSRWARSVGFSPDGSKIATGSDDKTAILWDARTGQKIATLAAHSGGVTSVAFSPDGSRVATGSEDKTAIIWDVKTGEKLVAMTGHAGGILSVCFSPDGSRLATAGSLNGPAGPALVWDAKTGRQLLTLGGAKSHFTSVRYSPDGSRLVTGAAVSSGAGSVVVWDAHTGRELKTLRSSGQVSSVAFSPDGTKVGVGVNSGGSGIVYDAKTGGVLVTLAGDGHGGAGSLCFSPDGSLAAAAEGGTVDDGTVVLWDAKTGQARVRIRHQKYVFGVCFSPDGTRVATASLDRTAAVWDARTGQRLLTLGRPADGVHALAASPRGSWLAAGSADATAILWDLRSGLKPATRRVEEANYAVSALCFSPDESKVVIASHYMLVVRDTGSGEKLAAWLGGRLVRSACFSPDGTRLAAGTLVDKQVTVWNARSGERLLSVKAAGEPTIPLGCYSPDGTRLATNLEDGTVAVWDGKTGNQLLTLRGHPTTVSSIGFSPDGSKLATAAGDKTAVVWDAKSGERVMTLEDDEPIYSAYFSPDNSRFVTGSGLKSAVVWDAKTGRKLATLVGPTDRQGPAIFDADGSKVITAWRDDTIRIWDAKTGAELLRLLTFDAGKDWLVCTPDGLFDGSADARRLVSYRMPGRGLVVPVDRFFDSCYRPGLLAAVLAGKKVEPAGEFFKLVPPAVRFVAAPAGEVNDPVLTLTVEVEDKGGGKDAPQVKHNGTRIEPSAPPTVEGTRLRQTFAVALVPGENLFTATAATNKGGWDSEPADIVVKYARAISKPRLFIMAAGINDYAEDGFQLKFAEGDARAVHDLFAARGRASGLYAEVKPTLLAGKHVTREGLRKAFERMAGEAKKEDVLVVMLAGHGVTADGLYYFIPADFRRTPGKTLEEDVRKQGVPNDVLCESIRAVPALKKVLILDTCHSGGAVKLLLASRDAFELRGAVERMNRNEGLFVLAAVPKEESAKEVPELGHGLLTYCLLAAANATDKGPLAGKGLKPTGPGGTIDVYGWFNHAAAQVPDLSKTFFGREVSAEPGASGQSFPILPARDP